MLNNVFNIILLGLQGSGKGTQANLLRQKFGFVVFEMGKTLREEALKQSSLGRKIDYFIHKKGKMIDDQTAFDIVKSGIAKIDKSKTIIFDGYPRNVLQLHTFTKLLTALERPGFVALNFKISEKEALLRLSKRLICPVCGGIFRNGDKKCDDCGVKLISRLDDKPELVKERISWTKKNLKPIIEELKAQKRLININGEQRIEKVFNDITKELDLY